MNTKVYLEQLHNYAKQFEDWWCKPYVIFRKKYMIRHPFFNFVMTRGSTENFNKAVDQFETEIRRSNDLIAKIFDFLDVNYEVYLNATNEERAEIRSTISNIYYPGPKSGIVHFTGHYMGEILFRYVREHVTEKIKLTSDGIWLTRGLIAISMENCSYDWRDTTNLLQDLYRIARQNKLHPYSHFSKIAEISSHETPRGGSTPMNEIMANIGS